ncbi:MAG: hypothetical protein PHG32_07055 [Candidatus Cloacimonetes bacterium]|nr:hypothetical protein [Candidatus Cloacimonadota bacterium]
MSKSLALLITLWIALTAAEGLSQKLVGADDLSVGDCFELEIRHTTDLKSVAVPDTLTRFHVSSWQLQKSPRGEDWLKVTIVPLYPGSHSFPALKVSTVDPAAEPLFTDRFRLNIIPVRAEADTLLVDMKPLRKYPLQLPWWLYPLLLVVALAGILFSLLRKHREAKTTAPEAAGSQPVIPDPAWKIALSSLDALRDEQLMLHGQYKLQHYRLSEILRQFLERRYRFAALEMSTSEINWVTQRIRVDSADEVLGFLRLCDRVKFAKYVPGFEEAAEAEEWLRGWLRSFEVEEARRKLAQVGGGDA